ncbi:MAG: HAD-IA family hydrolase [Lachnospiraceae bacterium]|nr:HAD-IA family hydrolase [Lachnospiraceae bacterium]
MKAPKMILFDYGQTLVNEKAFDGVKGTEAVLRYAVKNKYGKTAREVQAEADRINRELGRFDPQKKHLFQVEVPTSMFTSYLYASQGIELSIGPEDVDRVFWDAAAPGAPTEGVENFLRYLRENSIRTGVISNISYSGKVVSERIRACLPEHEFEFILATSEYMYRKPNRRIFELALLRAELAPEDVWYIGDQYECDIVGAAGAGLFPVWYQGAMDLSWEPKEGVLTVQSWGELREILEKSER